MIQHKSKILTFTLLAVCLMSINGAARAANVPAGTLLAEKQELVRNNGSEPASLDPHKVKATLSLI
jgi:oligopeptide transport system substrate-binding protein